MLPKLWDTPSVSKEIEAWGRFLCTSGVRYGVGSSCIMVSCSGGHDFLGFFRRSLFSEPLCRAYGYGVAGSEL